jgi:hypothetical protein
VIGAGQQPDEVAGVSAFATSIFGNTSVLAGISTLVFRRADRPLDRLGRGRHDGRCGRHHHGSTGFLVRQPS